MQVQIVDPSAYTPPYDHALAKALASELERVELVTSEFAYGLAPQPVGYERNEFFYKRSVASPGSRLRLLSKAAQHIPDMLRYRSHAASADVVHFQWLAMQQIDRYLLPKGKPTVLTAHDVLPREPKPGQLKAQRDLYNRVDAVVVHSQHGKQRLTAELGIAAEKIAVIEHGVFDYLTELTDTVPLPKQLAEVDKPVVLCFGLMRPYKGIDLLLDAWRDVEDAELWVVGMPKMSIESLQQAAPKSVRFVPRFITDREIPSFFKRADLIVLPYREIDQSGVLYTALAFDKPLLLSNVGGFPEVATHGAAQLFESGSRDALSAALKNLIGDQEELNKLAQQASQVAKTRYSWQTVAKKTVALYQDL